MDIFYSHPQEGVGTIPIAVVLAEVNHFEQEIASIPANAPTSAHYEIGLVYIEVSLLSTQIGHIQGETHETITYGKDGSETISETGLREAMSFSIGFGSATANATAFSSSPNVALASAATIAAAYNGHADAVAVAMGQNATATTSVG
jgi:hypothetical protein